ncbi:hypothetical protein C3K47_05155 [Solitalea longa]|uniref:Peptidase S9 prolyl oligopeptidase catalytic domain-containing protein n=1 Tax=Solitalea longa TaxID=2079460 RepID=A0A2S5A5W8_9SPHI|nr:prolyl oligopeptidase family serine peptidase [Solitalea longa]POY37916.1 hypothetical protein C3K47_05155 [Solitalea longa]
MKRLYFTALLGLLGLPCFAQKPVLDKSTFKNWTMTRSGAISNNGRYVKYVLSSSIYGAPTDKTIIQQVNGSWKSEIPSIQVTLTADSRLAISQVRDSLWLVQLGGSSIAYIPKVITYKLFSSGKQEYLMARKAADNEMLLRNLATGKQQSFTGVVDIVVSPNSTKLVVRFAGTKENGGLEQLVLLDPKTGKKTEVFKGIGLSNIVFDKIENKMAFSGMEKVGNGLERGFYCYTSGIGTVKVADSHSPGVEAGMNLERITFFNKGGNKLFIKLKPTPAPAAAATGVKVDVWSYLDAKVQSMQLEESTPDPFMLAMGAGSKELTAVLNLNTKRVLRLENEDDQTMFMPEGLEDEYVFPYTRSGYFDEAYWNKTSVPVQYAVSTTTGERKQIDFSIYIFSGISAGGKYTIGTDGKSPDIFSINPATGKGTNLTASLPVPKLNEEDDCAGPKPSAISIVGWTENDEALIISDGYDFWKIDPQAKKTPVSLTNGYGRRNRIQLGLTQRVTGPFKNNEAILLSGYNKLTHDNGFYNLHLDKPGEPELLTMGPYMYYMPYINPNDPPVKAKDANVWLLRRESTTESMNFFTTTDFKTFTPVTEVHPEKNYNWLTSELKSWKDVDGTNMPGVLYKPENFDPAKKYPVIIQYYQILTDHLHKFYLPEASTDNINIPWYVSQGYLVYTPDIRYPIPGRSGESALKSITGARELLSKQPYVDTTKIGIQGHSWGSMQTNYVITHTNMFAAAVSACGIADMISGYSYVHGKGSGANNQAFAERGQERMGATLWEHPERYIESSAVLRADKITTPLLMMNNRNDQVIPLSNGLELFLSMRRLGKPCWLLQYDDQAHSLYGEAVSMDYTTRMNQFFDHYLKGAPAPKWMVEGIPAAKKGIDSGFELSTEKDANGKPITPGVGLLRPESL